MKLFAWGANSYGQLGLGFKSEQEVEPKEVSLEKSELNAEDIVQIAGGAGHTLLLNKEGHVYSCGWNSKGQLGSSDETLHFELIDILKGFKVMQISCGWDYSAAVTECGKLFVWGNNAYTQLGLSKSITCTSIPTRLQISQKLATGFKQVSCGLRHMAVITKEDCVLVAGSGNKGQLGLGENHKEDNYLSISKVPDIEAAACIAVGQHHTLVLKADGTILGWGDNKYGQVGLDTKVSRVYKPTEIFQSEGIKAIYAGWTHSGILMNTGEVLLWGRNSYGQLGMYRNELHRPEKLVNLKDVIHISMGSEHNLAITKEDKLYSWGWNEHGNCGNGNTKDVVKPKQILTKYKIKYAAAGTGHSFAIVE